MTFQAHLAYPYLMTTIIAKIVGVHLSLMHSGILLVSSVIPDLDFVFIWLKDRVSLSLHHHTWVSHVPLYYLLFGLAVSYISMSVGIVFLIGTFSHFIMDMFFTGDGIRWLRPFSNREFYVDNPTRGIHGREWLKAYQALPIWRIDFIVLVVALAVFVHEYVI